MCIQLNVKLCERCLCLRVCRIRLSEGFHFAASGEGIVNMVIELPMRVKEASWTLSVLPVAIAVMEGRGCCFCVFRECRAWMQTERVILASFSISCFHLILLL